MANSKVPQLPILSAVTGDDLFYVVDVSDTTDDPTGSSKGITRDDILKNITGLTATTISATTISGGTMVITSTPTTDNTNTQVLSRDPSTGIVELVDMSSIQVSFNYGLANAIMTGNYLT